MVAVLRADMKSLRLMGRELRAIRPAAYKRTRLVMKEQASKIADDAKRNASWSTRIPGTIKASTSGALNAVIRAGGSKGSPASHAKPYEHGGSEGQFRHPVYGNKDNWVAENARPFLHPAAWKRMPETGRVLAEVLAACVEDIHSEEV